MTSESWLTSPHNASILRWKNMDASSQFVFGSAFFLDSNGCNLLRGLFTLDTEKRLKHCMALTLSLGIT